jgi:hypothetical protein
MYAIVGQYRWLGGAVLPRPKIGTELHGVGQSRRSIVFPPHEEDAEIHAVRESGKLCDQLARADDDAASGKRASILQGQSPAVPAGRNRAKGKLE